MKLFKSFILSVLFLFSFAFANTGGTENATDEGYKEVFGNSQTVIENGKCVYECKAVNGKYGTQITNVDIENGRTYCKVFMKNDYTKELKYEGGTINTVCAKEWQEKLSSTPSVDRKVNVASTIKFENNDHEISFSRFLTAMVTLDPLIINREQSKTAGTLVLSDGITTRGSVSGIYGIRLGVGDNFYDKVTNTITDVKGTLANMFAGKGIKTPIHIETAESVKLSDAMTQVNFVYFSNLFEAMNEVYLHLQNLLFVVVGMFFMGGIGARKLQSYFENRGASGNKEPFLHKFYVPLLSFGLFFMPIPEGKGDFEAQATVVQHTIRYFTANATKIADVASAKSAKVYMDKVYNAVGGITNEGEDYYKAMQVKNEFIHTKANQVIKEKCQKRYSLDNSKMGIPFIHMSEKEREAIGKEDNKSMHGTKNDISVTACIKAEMDMYEAQRKIKLAKKALEGIKKYQESDYISQFLDKIDKFSARREYELGWINASLLPGTAMVAEIGKNFARKSYDDFLIQSETGNKELSDKNAEAIKDTQKRGEQNVKGASYELTDTVLGWTMGKVIYGILPGYDTVKKTFAEFQETYPIFSTIFTFAVAENPILMSIAGMASIVAYDTVKPLMNLIVSAWFFDQIFIHLPIIVATVATTIAIVSYLVSLTKYYFISPFVVAFSITTRRMDKIVEFLVSGISLFFKPVLIVMFVYLSLFVYVYVKDFFLLLSELQFQIISSQEIGIVGMIAVSSIQGLLKIFASMASCFIMWKLIVGGAEWTMRYIGIDKDNDSTIAQSMSQHLERRAYNVM